MHEQDVFIYYIIRLVSFFFTVWLTVEVGRLNPEAGQVEIKILYANLSSGRKCCCFRVGQIKGGI